MLNVFICGWPFLLHKKHPNHTLVLEKINSKVVNMLYGIHMLIP